MVLAGRRHLSKRPDAVDQVCTRCGAERWVGPKWGPTFLTVEANRGSEVNMSPDFVGLSQRYGCSVPCRAGLDLNDWLWCFSKDLRRPGCSGGLGSGPTSGCLGHPGIEPSSPALQEGSLPAEPLKTTCQPTQAPQPQRRTKHNTGNWGLPVSRT